MKKTLVETANMCMARFSATDDVLFAHIAASFVILGGISYDELNPSVWTRKDYDAATIGEDDDDTPTYAEWMNRYEAELESGQTRITRDEAERRFYKQNQED